MRMKGITIQSKAVYALLCSYTGDKEFCFPSIESMAKDMNCSKESIMRYLKELCSVELVVKQKKNPHGWNQSNVYFIQFPQPVTGETLEPVNVETLEDVIDDTLILTVKNNNINNKNLDCFHASSPHIVNPKNLDSLNILTEWNKITSQTLKMTKSIERGIMATLNQYGKEKFISAIRGLAADRWSIDNKMVRLNRLIKPDKRDDNFNRFSKAEPIKLKYPEISSMTEKEFIEKIPEIIKNYSYEEHKTGLGENIYERWRGVKFWTGEFEAIGLEMIRGKK
jgi:predicted transcriptional regulator